jgi:peptide chain release factor 2
MSGMQELIKQLETLLAQVTEAMAKLDVASDRRQADELVAQTSQPDFWSRPDAAAVSQRLAGLQKHVDEWDGLQSQVGDTLDVARLSEDEGTKDEQFEAQLAATYQQAAAEYAKRELELKLSGPYDKNGAVVSVYAGTGGTDAQDWTEMLLRMYLRYCEKKGYKTEVLDRSDGEEAGIKRVTFEVSGPFAFGMLKSEKGVHRLVRLSPYNADNLRQTSFALVDVLPLLEQQQDVEIDAKDLRIDVYRSGGHGGQSVNTTDSAVRITHLPTGIVVAIQNERSQLQNKEKAMAILKSRLAAMMMEQHKEAVAELRGDTQSAAWGSQIRSYVLHPYTKVKDHRTGAETSQAGDVLDGEIEPFIEAYLQGQIGAGE